MDKCFAICIQTSMVMNAGLTQALQFGHHRLDVVLVLLSKCRLSFVAYLDDLHL